MTSPVIGTVLMIGVTVSLASLAALMITGPPSEPATVEAYAWGLDTQGGGVDTIRVVLAHASPSTVPANTLTIRYGPTDGRMVAVILDEPVTAGTGFLLPCTGPGWHSVTFATATSAPPLNIRCDGTFDLGLNVERDEPYQSHELQEDCPSLADSLKAHDLVCLLEPFMGGGSDDV